MSPSVLTSGLPIEATDKEAAIKRNPHRNWETIQASRPNYDSSHFWAPSKTPVPTWNVGDGSSSDDWKQYRRLNISPDDDDRTNVQNYKLMISTTVPRPVALVTTVGKDGVSNMAPFSYFQNVCTDPPLYSLSLVGEEPNDTLRNILDTKECTLNIISDWFIEAANFSSANTPPHQSEWPMTGLTPSPSQMIRPASVAESAFSAECKLHSYQDIFNKKGTRMATLVLLEAVMWHVREDMVAKDALKATVDLKLLRPVWRGGGIIYGTCFQGFELPRPEAWRKVLEESEVARRLSSA
ncbi:hypothetical protein P154DRAFT_596210 [Amniculicola lignicola CBS 123094]|uniref:Flavin reductase like domain-containing protein n=1 Tax=Amniculicola lignicola CBS 123094 TaxID=1392246 RepID=A0A6A5WN30_9PLEO|nr:hypothetical protein P154DRAFT_596210 [Amniculicola lignicola CBS 123094]